MTTMKKKKKNNEKRNTNATQPTHSNCVQDIKVTHARR